MYSDVNDFALVPVPVRKQPSLFARISSALGSRFRSDKITFFSLLIVFLFSALTGALYAVRFPAATCKLTDFLIPISNGNFSDTLYHIRYYVFALLLVSVSGMTVFLRIVGFFFICLSAFAFGVSSNDVVVICLDSPFRTLALWFMIVCYIFTLIIYTGTAIAYSKKAFLGRKELLAVRPLLGYLAFVLITNVFIIFDLHIIFLITAG